jgi:hypothetical protein
MAAAASLRRPAHAVGVGRVLINEPHADVRALLTFVVRRLGHEAVLADGTLDQLVGADAYVFEPGHDAALALAAWARQHAPRVALVCASIFPPGHATAALEPDAYLVKPFPLEQLEHALVAALRERVAASVG